MINDHIFFPDVLPQKNSATAPAALSMSRTSSPDASISRSSLINATATTQSSSAERRPLIGWGHLNSAPIRAANDNVNTYLSHMEPLNKVDALTVSQSTSKKLDFQKLLTLMQRSAVIYEEDSAKIREHFPNMRSIVTLCQTGIKFAVEDCDNGKSHLLTIRGTDNLKNTIQDMEYAFTYDDELGIYVHKGFRDDARTILHHLESNELISKTTPIGVTGHSLGGALANLLLCYLHKGGYKILPSTTFGQPKVTNAKGVAHYKDIDLTRVVYDDDIVPFVPPTTLITAFRGPYQQMGNELILLDGAAFCFLEAKDAKRKSVNSFWKNAFHEHSPEHKIERYVVSLEEKQAGAKEVSYEQKSDYVHPVRRMINCLPCCDDADEQTAHD